MKNSSKNIAAILMYIILMICGSLLGVIGKMFPFLFNSTSMIMITTTIFNIIVLCIMLFLCKHYDISLENIGLTKKHFKESFLLGIFVIVIYILLKGVLVKSFIEISVIDFFVRFVYDLFLVALFEEIVFRGFIGKNLYIYNRAVSILIVGLLFASMHMPFQIIMGQSSLADFHLGRILGYTIMHTIFQLLFDKYDALAAPTLLHFFHNFISSMIK